MARRFNTADFRYAHRGLWTYQGPPENSLAAFRAAAGAGLGIEFDLRPSADGQIMIFHDDTLERMTGLPGRVEEHRAADLNEMRLTGSREQIPRLEDLLAFWPGELPLLAELKVDGRTDPKAFARKVGQRLIEWDGLAAAMSFSPAAVQALPDALLRGQLIERSGMPDELEAAGQRALAAGADYLGIHVSDLNSAASALQMPRGGLVVWTVSEAVTAQKAEGLGIGVIFEYPGTPEDQGGARSHAV